MQGLVFFGNREIELKQFPQPEPGPGEVIVRVRASGMCGSDLHFYRGGPAAAPGQFIQGHEPCGEVHAVGTGVNELMAKVGDRVMIHHYWGCNTCEQCRSGWPQLCTETEVRTLCVNAHGGHAPYVAVPANTLMPLPDELSFKAGAAIGCGTGTAWGGLKRLGDVGGSTVVVSGQGPVGMSATMLASAMGARVIAVDIENSRLAKAKEFGAAETVNPMEHDAVGAVRELTGGRGTLFALETSGATVAAQATQDMLATWGRACFIGLGADVEFNTTRSYKRQMTLMTSWTMSIIEQKRCADFVAERKLPVDKLYSHSWSLTEAAEAYEWFDKQTDGKGVFEF
ncbi:iditol 2-dehydrogenase [Rhodococcus sp. WS1]|uniref:zinc-dependent alcohol dehydrogenase family protein n=1 Tax=unclassified Rhodococcus (in: high G+C Gram-positive bacteria) TaxID=192944 RepID=UPI0011417D67|nr:MULTISPECIES: zinc-binding dehydrogenase [unclassified Rhodococcus (in: high G+C Gram-positive bacteria)]ROZ52896.1 iditol 2-dehydrogenase [Rhodococcus sp. WS1]TQC35987.1 iditol 2-dehydrogenase [Rhodococcus sp. WS7]